MFYIRIGKMCKSGIFLWVCLWTAACSTSVEDLEAYLAGSWEGEDEKYKWCVSYKTHETYKSAEMYTVKKSANDLPPSFVIYSEGALAVKRGQRFELNLSRTHDVLGVPLAADKPSNLFSAYVVKVMTEQSFTYISVDSETEYKNFRVESCSAYEAAFFTHLEQSQKN